MRAIVIFTTVVAAVLARPDVSHLGYKYNQPNGGSGNGASFNKYAGNGFSDSASFGSSSSSVTAGEGFDNGYNAQFSANSGQSADEFNSASNGLTDGSNGFSSRSNGFEADSNSFAAGSNGFAAGSNGFAAGSNGFAAGSNGFAAGSNGNGANGGSTFVEGHSQTVDLTGGSNGGQRVVYKPVIKQGEPIITKNFYVHAAPEEDENVRVEEKIQVVRPQKTYKIIFIKAPSISSSSAAHYPVYPQNEEKTIVYVLSKKDDILTETGEIPIPPPPVTHKPDVFFIKYKTRKEASDAVANIQAQFQTESQATAGAFGSESNDNNIDIRVDSDDKRVDENDSYDQANIAGAVDSGAQTFQTSSQTEFGPTGGQVSFETSFESNGAAANDGQTFYTDSGNEGQSHTQPQENPAFTSDSSSSSAEFLPQNIIQINSDQSAFRQTYLPPNGCNNC